MALGEVNSTSADEAVLGHGALSREALIAANVNPDTGLATDYLNHFNEVIMLMEMLPDMPDCVEDVLAWEPLDYCSHFEMSALKDKDIAVLAYQSAPQAVKAHLETLVMQASRGSRHWCLRERLGARARRIVVGTSQKFFTPRSIIRSLPGPMAA